MHTYIKVWMIYFVDTWTISLLISVYNVCLCKEEWLGLSLGQQSRIRKTVDRIASSRWNQKSCGTCASTAGHCQRVMNGHEPIHPHPNRKTMQKWKEEMFFISPCSLYRINVLFVFVLFSLSYDFLLYRESCVSHKEMY